MVEALIRLNSLTESTEVVRKGMAMVCHWTHHRRRGAEGERRCFHGLSTMVNGAERKHRRAWEGVTKDLSG